MFASNKCRGSRSSACAIHARRQMLKSGSSWPGTRVVRCSACGQVSITVSAESSTTALRRGRRVIGSEQRTPGVEQRGGECLQRGERGNPPGTVMRRHHGREPDEDGKEDRRQPARRQQTAIGQGRQNVERDEQSVG